jgi:hypothetical protein
MNLNRFRGLELADLEINIHNGVGLSCFFLCLKIPEKTLQTSWRLKETSMLPPGHPPRRQFNNHSDQAHLPTQMLALVYGTDVAHAVSAGFQFSTSKPAAALGDRPSGGKPKPEF